MSRLFLNPKRELTKHWWLSCFPHHLSLLSHKTDLFGNPVNSSATTKRVSVWIGCVLDPLQYSSNSTQAAEVESVFNQKSGKLIRQERLTTLVGTLVRTKVENNFVANLGQPGVCIAKNQSSMECIARGTLSSLSDRSRLAKWICPDVQKKFSVEQNDQTMTGLGWVFYFIDFLHPQKKYFMLYVKEK